MKKNCSLEEFGVSGRVGLEVGVEGGMGWGDQHLSCECG